MITTCTKCRMLFDRATPTESLCPHCSAIAELIDCVDSLVLWKLKVDVTSGGQSADELLTLIERAEAAAAKARQL